MARLLTAAAGTGLLATACGGSSSETTGSDDALRSGAAAQHVGAQFVAVAGSASSEHHRVEIQINPSQASRSAGPSARVTSQEAARGGIGRNTSAAHSDNSPEGAR